VAPGGSSTAGEKQGKFNYGGTELNEVAWTERASFPDMTIDPEAVMRTCLEDLERDPAVAAKSISSRVMRLDRPDRIGVLISVLDEAGPEWFWPIFLDWWSDFEFPHKCEDLPDRLREMPIDSKLRRPTNAFLTTYRTR
jgi:hypothetical protein